MTYRTGLARAPYKIMLCEVLHGCNRHRGFPSAHLRTEYACPREGVLNQNVHQFSNLTIQIRFIGSICSLPTLQRVLEVQVMNTGAPRCTVLCFIVLHTCVFHTFMVCGSPSPSTSISTMFPTAFPLFKSLRYILVILAIFQTFPL